MLEDRDNPDFVTNIQDNLGYVRRQIMLEDRDNWRDRDNPDYVRIRDRDSLDYFRDKDSLDYVRRQR